MTLADKLSGGQSEISLIWINLTIVEALEEVPGEAKMINTPDEVLEPEHVVFTDYLKKDTGPSADDDIDDDPPTITAELIWELPEILFFK
jgi:hypothetical protein